MSFAEYVRDVDCTETRESHESPVKKKGPLHSSPQQESRPICSQMMSRSKPANQSSEGRATKIPHRALSPQQTRSGAALAFARLVQLMKIEPGASAYARRMWYGAVLSSPAVAPRGRAVTARRKNLDEPRSCQ